MDDVERHFTTAPRRFARRRGYRTVFVSALQRADELGERLGAAVGRLEAFALSAPPDARVRLDAGLRLLGVSYVCEPGRMIAAADWPARRRTRTAARGDAMSVSRKAFAMIAQTSPARSALRLIPVPRFVAIHRRRGRHPDLIAGSGCRPRPRRSGCADAIADPGPPPSARTV